MNEIKARNTLGRDIHDKEISGFWFYYPFIFSKLPILLVPIVWNLYWVLHSWILCLFNRTVMTVIHSLLVRILMCIRSYLSYCPTIFFFFLNCTGFSLWHMGFFQLHKWWVKRKLLSTQSCPTLWNPKHCSPPGSSIHDFLPARIFVWVAVPSPGGGGSSWPTDGHTLAGGFFITSVTCEAPMVTTLHCGVTGFSLWWIL